MSNLCYGLSGTVCGWNNQKGMITLDTKIMAPDIVDYCNMRWSRGEVVEAFTDLCGCDETKWAKSGIASELAMLLEGLVVANPSVTIRDVTSGNIELFVTQLAEDCLNEVRRTIMAREIIVWEAKMGELSQVAKIEVGRYNNGTTALMHLNGRRIKEVEWDGLDLVVQVAPQG